MTNWIEMLTENGTAQGNLGEKTRQPPVIAEQDKDQSPWQQFLSAKVLDLLASGWTDRELEVLAKHPPQTVTEHDPADGPITVGADGTINIPWRDTMSNGQKSHLMVKTIHSAVWHRTKSPNRLPDWCRLSCDRYEMQAGRHGCVQDNGDWLAVRYLPGCPKVNARRGERPQERPKTAVSAPVSKRPHPRTISFLARHMEDLKAAGWTSPELWRRNRAKGIAWLSLWSRPDVDVTLEDGRIVFTWTDEAGRPVKQVARSQRSLWRRPLASHILGPGRPSRINKFCKMPLPQTS